MLLCTPGWILLTGNVAMHYRLDIVLVPNDTITMVCGWGKINVYLSALSAAAFMLFWISEEILNCKHLGGSMSEEGFQSVLVDLKIECFMIHTVDLSIYIYIYE